MKVKPVQFAIVLVFIFLFCRFSFADGFYIPEVRKKIPDIPVQRAIVKYRDGVETLIVESTFNGEGNNFGWIIPVPEEPSKLGAFSPGLLKTLSFQLQPKIKPKKRTRRVFGIRLEYFFWFAIGWISMFTLFLGWNWGLKIWGLTIVVYFGSVMLSNMVYRDAAGPSLSGMDSVEIRSAQTIGDYEVFVLGADKSTDLSAWLKDNGFRPFPEEAFAAVNYYIREHWYFVAAKLTREHDGISAPHPLLIEFETDRPVYPMRLTALQGAAVNLELFVIAEAQAVAKGYRLKKGYCNIFDYRKIPSWEPWYTPATKFGFVGRKYFGPNREIGHPDAAKIMWDGSVLTKLTGRVKPKSMKKDMYFKFKRAVPYRPVYYTIGAARDLFYLIGIALFMFGFPILAGSYQRTGERFLLLLFISTNLMIWPYALLGKKIETLDMKQAWPNYVASAHFAASDAVPDQDTTDKELLDQLTEAEELINPFTQKVAVLEDSPGNITVKREGGFIMGVNLYRWDGSVIFIPL